LGGGSVRIAGIDLAAASRKTLRDLRLRLGVVFQEGALLNNMSIYDNIALPLRYHTNLPEREVGGRVEKVMGLFEIHRENDRAIPAQVSTGVRRRAAFARALILDPSLLFLDEPALGLENEDALRIVQILKRYREKNRATLFFTTSAGSPALLLANRLGILKNGRICWEGPPGEIEAQLAKERTSSGTFPPPEDEMP